MSPTAAAPLALDPGSAPTRSRTLIRRTLAAVWLLTRWSLLTLAAVCGVTCYALVYALAPTRRAGMAAALRRVLARRVLASLRTDVTL